MSVYTKVTKTKRSNFIGLNFLIVENLTNTGKPFSEYRTLANLGTLRSTSLANPNTVLAFYRRVEGVLDALIASEQIPIEGKAKIKDKFREAITHFTPSSPPPAPIVTKRVTGRDSVLKEFGLLN
jgi:hypothetical protein